MANDSGLDLSAFEAHLNALDHRQISSPAMPGPDLYAQLTRGVTPNPVVVAPLKSAINALHPSDQERASEGTREGTQEATKPTEPVNSFDPQSAKSRLAQEALLAKPAEMRALFPALLKDVSLNHNDHLDIDEIDKGLQNARLSQAEMNFLTVLKKGYKELSLQPYGSADPDGINEGGLAVLDKALNRQLNEDPIYSYNAKKDLWSGLSAGVATGAYSGIRSGDVMTGLGAGVGVAVSGTLVFEAETWITKVTGGEDKDYDKVEADFKAFAAKY